MCNLAIKLTQKQVMENEINEYLDHKIMSLQDWETLLNNGWDRVGTHFFRRRYDFYTIPLFQMELKMQLMPLRYDLRNNLDKNNQFPFSKSQKILKRRNQNLTCIFQNAHITDEKMRLFDDWYEDRFQTQSNVFNWVSNDKTPFESYEISIYDKDKLIACSFFDQTKTLQYSTTAFFDPNEAKRSLGTYTLMLEIEQGIKDKKHFHHPGHAYQITSKYDYKKKIPNAEHFDWDLQLWLPLERLI